ncbi:MAG: hypothetical protein QGH58_00840 [Arenicellales bacterium]|nr:hypothetical protein [Arenicellales bacterium]MDP6790430.1 hypothetical protein [Arenicellales bacterium]MDP6919549.1 hypothetical protein [Arenicellales bacterium]
MTSAGDYPWLQSTRQKLVGDRRELHHCLFLAGGPAIGKAMLALEFAAQLLCEDSGTEGPCKKCRACHLLCSSLHPDFHVLMPEFLTESSDPILESHAQRYLEPARTGQKRKPSEQISIDSARALSEALLTTVRPGGRKVVLIVGADTMNRNTANAMLKVLEEPTEGTRFILVSSYPYRLPATIHSRCIRLDCRAPSQDETIRWLQSRHGASPNDLIGLAKSGLGPMDLDEIIREDRAAMVQDLIRCCENPSGKAASPLFLSSLCAQIGTRQALSILQSTALDAVRQSLQGPPEGAQQPRSLFADQNLAFEAFYRLGAARERVNGQVDEQLCLEDICAWLSADRHYSQSRP